MQTCKEKQGEMKKPSSSIKAKKQENNRMGRTRNLFKKIRDTKGTFHTKIGTIKDRNARKTTNGHIQTTALPFVNIRLQCPDNKATFSAQVVIQAKSEQVNSAIAKRAT